MERVTVFGLGNLGLPAAISLARAGYKVTGVDVDAERVKRINAGKNPLPHEAGLGQALASALSNGSFTATADASSAAANATVHVIITPTGWKNGAVDVESVEQACAAIAAGLKKGDLVVVECTMPPGGTRRMASHLESSGLKAGRDFSLAYCPERSYSGTSLNDIEARFPRVVSGIDAQSARAAAEFYARVHSKGVVTAASLEEAELAKLFEGIYRDVNVALANELADACEALGASYWRVLDVQRKGTDGYVDLHKPGPGVGGHCIPVYPMFLLSVLEKDLHIVGAARRENDLRPRQVVELVTRNCPVGKACVLGLSFRAGVREHRNSPALGVIAGLRSAGFDVWCVDPYYSPDEVRAVAGCSSGALEECLAGAKAVVVVTDHAEYRELDWPGLQELFKGGVLFDCRNAVAGAPDGLRVVRLGEGRGA